MPNLPSIAQNLQAVRARIDRAAAAAQRSPDSIRLLAVSKTFAPTAVAEAAAAGQTAFGESYVQEAVAKIEAVRALGWRGLQWHCIGHVQTRKSKLVAEHFDWLHSLDRVELAERLSRQRPAQLPPLRVCVQVNMDGGAHKSGVPPEQAEALARAVLALPNLTLRGLMSIPEPYEDAHRLLAVHRETRVLFEQLGRNLPLPRGQWDTLSMGMSADLEAAVAAGSTLVRVGSALFGARPRPA